MDKLFTPLYESNADEVAPELARVSVAGGVYFWLYSRAFAQKNNIKVSVVDLARYVQKDRSTVQNAIKRLVEEGLIIHKTYKHNGGGSVFHVVKLRDAEFSLHLKGSSCCENVASGVLNKLHQVQQISCTTKNKDIKDIDIGIDYRKSRSPYDY